MRRSRPWGLVPPRSRGVRCHEGVRPAPVGGGLVRRFVGSDPDAPPPRPVRRRRRPVRTRRASFTQARPWCLRRRASASSIRTPRPPPKRARQPTGTHSVRKSPPMGAVLGPLLDYQRPGNRACGAKAAPTPRQRGAPGCLAPARRNDTPRPRRTIPTSPMRRGRSGGIGMRGCRDRWPARVSRPPRAARLHCAQRPCSVVRSGPRDPFYDPLPTALASSSLLILERPSTSCFLAFS